MTAPPNGAPSVAQQQVSAGANNGRGSPWKQRTHCEHGHEYTPANIMPRVDSSGRRCRECQRERGRRWYATRGHALRAARRHQPKPTPVFPVLHTQKTGTE